MKFIHTNKLLKVAPDNAAQVAEIFAAGFQNDPFFRYALPDASCRLGKLTAFFRSYVALLYELGDLYASSERMEALAFIYRPAKFPWGSREYWRCWQKRMQALLVFVGTMKARGLRTLPILEQDWQQQCIQGQYVHLELLVVQEKYQGRGWARKMLERIQAECMRIHLPCSLETHNPSNVDLYQHFDFETVETMVLPSGLRQYCMLFEDN